MKIHIHNIINLDFFIILFNSCDIQNPKTKLKVVSKKSKTEWFIYFCYFFVFCFVSFDYLIIVIVWLLFIKRRKRKERSFLFFIFCFLLSVSPIFSTWWRTVLFLFFNSLFWFVWRKKVLFSLLFLKRIHTFYFMVFFFFTKQINCVFVFLVFWIFFFFWLFFSVLSFFLFFSAKYMAFLNKKPTILQIYCYIIVLLFFFCFFVFFYCFVFFTVVKEIDYFKLFFLLLF